MKLYQKMKTTGGYRLSLKMSVGLVRGTLATVGGSGGVRKFKTIKIFAKIRENLKNFTKILQFYKNLKYLKYRPIHLMFTDQLSHHAYNIITYSMRSISYMYTQYINPPVRKRIQPIRIYNIKMINMHI